MKTKFKSSSDKPLSATEILAVLIQESGLQAPLFDDKAIPIPASKQKQSIWMEKEKVPAAVAQQSDLFVANLIDPNFRDERDALEFCMVSLEKGKRTKPIEFKTDTVHVKITASAEYGMASIWDWDFMLWAASQINEAIESGIPVSRTLRFSAYSFLVQTGRIEPGANGSRGSKQYKDFEANLDRLQNTGVKTNIKADGKIFIESFSWIDTWRAIKDESTGRLIYMEVVLSEWFYTRISKDRAVLSIDQSYFLLKKGIERWLYRIARKANGWKFTIHQLHERYPTGREFRKFKSDLKTIVALNELPEYDCSWIIGEDGTEFVEFRPRQFTLANRKISRAKRITATE